MHIIQTFWPTWQTLARSANAPVSRGIPVSAGRDDARREAGAREESARPPRVAAMHNRPAAGGRGSKTSAAAPSMHV
jgi:hypothetical protein